MQDSQIGPDEQTHNRRDTMMSLQVEIEMLRAALQVIQSDLQSGEADVAKSAAMLARLSDSIGRAMLAHQRLNRGSSDEVERLKAIIDELMRAM